MSQFISRQQRAALSHPCRFAFETMHPRFKWIDKGMSFILSVNYGYE